MTKVRFSPSAQRDVDRIWNYSAENWGNQRANIYVRSIEDAAKRIAENPSVGASAEEYRSGYRKLNVESHTIFFKEARSDLIVIARILHQSMDAARHLDG